jgi:hypothetical protein
MSHSQVLDELSSEHLQSCADCAAYAQEIISLCQALDTMQVPAPADLRLVLPSSKPRLRLAHLLAAAVALFCLAAAGWFVYDALVKREPYVRKRKNLMQAPEINRGANSPNAQSAKPK